MNQKLFTCRILSAHRAGHGHSHILRGAGTQHHLGQIVKNKVAGGDFVYAGEIFLGAAVGRITIEGKGLSVLEVVFQAARSLMDFS